ncbi:MAG: EAL domain-containing protein [Rubrivivax sp.]|nr:EAL domain-containing protein [Rubrivivax sp.]
MAPTLPAGLWARFARRHLFDYNAAATRIWLGLVASGSLAAAWALAQLAALPAAAQLQVAAGIAFVVLAALFPVQIPRTKYSIGVADIFVFAMLGLHGASAAALAAGAEGLVGVLSTSKRLTSRLGTPATATLAMALSGLGFEAASRALETAGVPAGVATMAALCALALAYFAASTLPLLALVAAKSGQRLSLRDWIQGYGWVGTIYLLSAAVAGLLVINARHFGPAMIVVAGTVAAAGVALVRVSLRRHEADLQAQEARVAEAENEAALNQKRFTAAFTHAAIGMAIVRHDGSIHQVNQALCALLGRADPELLGRPFADLLHPGDAALFSRRAEAVAGGAGEAFSTELRCCDATGQGIWVSLHCGRFIDPADERGGLIYQLHDITSRRLAEDELHHIAYHDDLTDLANRNYFHERLGLAVADARGDPARRFAVLFLDLDRFKVVNDSLGHAAGNMLLRQVARRLSDGVRPGDLVARLGGDEFAVLLEQVQEGDGALALAQRLLVALSAPMTINGTEVLPGASIGITLSDIGERTVDEVLRDADLAMYAAKAGGRQRVALFDASMHERIAEKLKLEGDLRRAIGEGQLSLVYQPLFALEPRRLVGFEALARWMHPERGPVSPEVFITLAEESGHIEALTAWVVDQGAGQLVQWHASHPEMAHLCMHINISGRDLTSSELVPQVRAALRKHGLAPQRLTLEITETTLMGKLERVLDTLQALRMLGVKFSIDDFGTGYSSLAYLSRLPIDSLKIDRSFVRRLDEQPQNVEIVRAVHTLGGSLGKAIIAEGIETVEELAMLKEIGVQFGQGYLLSRPLRADQVPALLEAEAAERAGESPPQEVVQKVPVPVPVRPDSARPPLAVSLPSRPPKKLGERSRASLATDWTRL